MGHVTNHGNTHGHIWPEWPQILQALLPQYQVIVKSGVGAGNEFLIDQLLNSSCQGHSVIFQWAHANRFDKLLQDDYWTYMAKQDPVYFFNFETNPSGTWWLSSASQNQKIQEYHNFFVQSQQSQLRLKNQKILVENYLQNQNCNYWFTSTYEQEQFSCAHKENYLRGTEIQPGPQMHFYFVVECIKPALNLQIDKDLQQKLQTLISNTRWKSYDPDRVEIWQNICTQISS
jgi:hypothetical protein